MIKYILKPTLDMPVICFFKFVSFLISVLEKQRSMEVSMVFKVITLSLLFHMVLGLDRDLSCAGNHGSQCSALGNKRETVLMEGHSMFLWRNMENYSCYTCTFFIPSSDLAALCSKQESFQL